ncbi:MAG: thiol:disulfide interchange protein [Gammaproteobacteria bacterium RIFCSPHIGHO2_12_FULL_63_22]|nr:MAG: thiol:disulfide interchange protein [Gammaproteobacteria bacterium RIFCSPHIGHO2_12_FULL_63_22]
MIRRLLPLLFFAALAALLFVGVRMNSGRDTSAIPSPLIGKPVPTFSLPVLGDASRMVSNTDLRGKPFLMNVWGSWCPTCREEHPHITALARSGKVRVIGYNYKDEPADAQRWLQEFGDPFEFNLADQEGRAALDWGIYGAPETFLVDANGVVRWKLVGPITEQIIREQIEPQLAAMGPAP